VEDSKEKERGNKQRSMIVVVGPLPEKEETAPRISAKLSSQLESWENSMEKANFTSPHLLSDSIMPEGTCATALNSHRNQHLQPTDTHFGESCIVT
jgi:hypothetical protein